MKQCPNPNCILYTRLEELPDAYLKCPGCGGQLVDTTLSTGALKSGHLTGRGSLMPPGGYAEPYEDDYDDAFEPPEPPVPRFTPYPQAPAPQPGQPVQPAAAAPISSVEYADAEYYPYEQAEQQPDAAVAVQAQPISLWTRIAFLAGAFLLVFACVLFAYVLVTRVFRQPTVLLTVQATETAVSQLKPPVNTPIAVMPTVPSSETLPTPTSAEVAVVVATATPEPAVVAPSPTPEPPPTEAPPTPTDILPAPATAAPPAPTPVPPTAVPAPTAPPAQPQPAGGILDAYMAAGVSGGRPTGRVTEYSPTGAFTVAVQAQYGEGGVTSLVTRWYGPDGVLLYELPRQFAQAGTYYTSFTLRKDTPWLPGTYRVDIHANGSATPSYTVRFSVVP
jgi:hypothetical protein